MLIVYSNDAIKFLYKNVFFSDLNVSLCFSAETWISHWSWPWLC